MKYHIERSIDIDAPLGAVWELVADFTLWNKWSPWTIAEPTCKQVIEGTPGEISHSMTWEGEIIGSGKNTLIAVQEKKLSYDLQFVKPFTSRAKVAFLFEPKGGGTKVTWTMDSSMPFFLFFMLDMMKGWIAMDYDRGLRMLKAVAEYGNVPAKTSNKGKVEIPGFSYVGITRTVAMEEVGTLMPQDFDTILDDIVVKGGKSPKHWITLYPKMDMKNMRMTYIAAVSDEDLEGLTLGDEYVRGTVAAGNALEISHDGPYEYIGNAWAMGMMITRAKKMKKRGVPYEQYWNSPKEVQPNELKSSVFFPVK